MLHLIAEVDKVLRERGILWEQDRLRNGAQAVLLIEWLNVCLRDAGYAIKAEKVAAVVNVAAEPNQVRAFAVGGR